MGRGPVGVILTTMTDGFEVGKLVLKDIENNSLETRSNREESLNILRSRGRTVTKFLAFLKMLFNSRGRISSKSVFASLPYRNLFLKERSSPR